MERQSDIEWIPPEAGVVCFPKIKEDIHIDPEEVYRLAAEKYRTFVVPGRCFEMPSRHFRIGFGADADELKEGLSRLEKAIEDIKVS
jgi:aspartate/methionine/tyrosine aminotransferase